MDDCPFACGYFGYKPGSCRRFGGDPLTWQVGALRPVPACIGPCPQDHEPTCVAKGYKGGACIGTGGAPLACCCNSA
ncbi:unnamed protein product [Dovyalis caffra]|uniref:Uncharacterized protein n=1 Tax=Dovyalis caffra TaxID=77055 RepID=A0AAV1SPW3_9ROSI|nr:unnamed protein product [Dovyalis caffra]